MKTRGHEPGNRVRIFELPERRVCKTRGTNRYETRKNRVHTRAPCGLCTYHRDNSLQAKQKCKQNASRSCINLYKSWELCGRVVHQETR